jgi:predicted lipoprotein with Yx(FWY)xxD motif
MTALISRPRTARGLLLLRPLAGLAVLAAACGSTSVAGNTSGSGPSSGSGAHGAPSLTPGSAAATPTATIAVRATRLGEILVDGQGRTLYLFEKDQGSTSTCSGSCASVWPPLTTSGATQAATGASSALIATTARNDGKTQVTYQGHPLYYYVGDNNPGDTNGEGIDQFGGGWDVLSPQGMKIEK